MAVETSELVPKGSDDWVCPLCEEVLPEDTPPKSGRLPRCPAHSLAYVRRQALHEAFHDPLLGTTVVGRFTIMSRLGRGAMGAVYRARQEAFGRDVALKIVRSDRSFDSETRTRFGREAKATSSLTSPHTVTVFDFGEAEDGAWFLAMELLEGETVGQRLKRLSVLPWRQAMWIARQALQSLAEAHNKGIIHRDLKPDNLFLVRPQAELGEEAKEFCKVLDFGIAKLMREDRELDSLQTQAGTVFGTPRYMSPEQAQGAELDARSDLYSLGVILYQMLTGQPPFADDDAVVVMARHIRELPPKFETLSPELELPEPLEALVRRALSKDRALRPQTADEFIRALDHAVALSEQAAASGLGRSWARLRHRTSRRWAALPRPVRRALLAVALLSPALGIAVLLAHDRPAGAPPAKARVAAGELKALSEPKQRENPLARPVVSSPSPSSLLADAGAAETPKDPQGRPKTSARGSGARQQSVSVEPPRPGERYGRFR